MKNIILLNGLIASGKTTIGKMLVDALMAAGNNAVFFDLDEEVLLIDSSDEMRSEEKRQKTWLQARKNLAIKITQSLHDEYETGVIVGPFFYRNEIFGLTDYLPNEFMVYLFTLTASASTRNQRDSGRTQSNTKEKLFEQEKILITHPPMTPGVTIDNNGEAAVTVQKIFDMYNMRQGVVNRNMERMA